jgi:hypothetical protein
VPIWKVDGRGFLDSGTVVVSSEAAVEIRIERKGKPHHEVAIKIRNRENEQESQVKFGNPRPDRTVVHLINFDEPVAEDVIHIGKIGDENLRLSYVIHPTWSLEAKIRWLTYTLYVGDF